MQGNTERGDRAVTRISRILAPLLPHVVVHQIGRSVIIATTATMGMLMYGAVVALPFHTLALTSINRTRDRNATCWHFTILISGD